MKRRRLADTSNIPIRLAWAITVHKSQGLTFNQVKIDFTGGVFAGGQTYVALSRCTSLEGISLQEPIRHSEVFVRNEVKQFARQYNDQNTINTALTQSKADRQYHDAVKAYDKGDMQAALDNFFLAIHSRYDIEHPLAKRFIRKKLNKVNELQAENERLREVIKQKDEEEKEAGEIPEAPSHGVCHHGQGMREGGNERSCHHQLQEGAHPLS